MFLPQLVKYFVGITVFSGALVAVGLECLP